MNESGSSGFVTFPFPCHGDRGAPDDGGSIRFVLECSDYRMFIMRNFENTERYWKYTCTEIT